jgi:cytochrome c-type biogenesis protein CcmH
MIFKSGRVRRFVLVLATGLAWWPSLANAHDQQAAALTRELMSPFCPGLLLSDCQSSGAGDLRAEIRARLEAGESKDQIVEDLVVRFGPGVRGRPETQGFGGVAWAFPLFLGVGTLLVVVRRLRKATPDANEQRCAPASADEDTVTAARIDAELCALE